MHQIVLPGMTNDANHLRERRAPTSEGVVDAAESLNASLDEAGSIAIDLPCKGCDYNLRGLPPEGECPECGAPVARSLTSNLLRFANPVWLKNVRRGLGLVLASIVSGIVCLAAIVALGCLIRTVEVERTVSLFSFAAGLVGLWGIWLMTVPEPGKAGDSAGYTTPQWTRLWSIASYVAGFLAMVAGTFRTEFFFRVPVMLLEFTAGVIGVIAYYFLVVLCGKLASRVPVPSATRRARLLSWWLPGTMLFMFAVTLLITITAYTLPRTQTAHPVIIGGVVAQILAMAVLLACTISYFILLWRIRKLLHQQVLLADAHQRQ